MNQPANDFEVAVAHKAVVERLWTEPVFEACRDLLPSPSGATVLVAEARCGYVPVHLIDELPEDTRIIALDQQSAMLDTARNRVEELEGADRIYFVNQQIDSLSYADDVFEAGVCLNGLCLLEEALNGVEELARVTAAGGRVVVAAPLVTSYPEFYDMLDEALRAEQLSADVSPRVERMRDSLLTPSRLAAVARKAGLHGVEVERLH